MTCGEARDLFSALVDEALSPDERARLDRHLAGCADCRDELQRFRSVVSLVRAVQPERAPVGFVATVYLTERARSGREEAWPRTRESLRAVATSIGIELATGLVIAAIWFAAVVFG